MLQSSFKATAQTNNLIEVYFSNIQRHVICKLTVTYNRLHTKKEQQHQKKMRYSCSLCIECKSAAVSAQSTLRLRADFEEQPNILTACHVALF